MAEGGDTYDDSRLPQDMNDVEFNKYLEKKFHKFHQEAAKRTAAATPLPVDEDVYDFNYKNRGLAIIFNNKNFTRSGEEREDPNLTLEGNPVDGRNLNSAFSALGFDVLICFNYTAKRMLLTAQKAAKHYNHNDADCFMCVLITHGDELSDRRGIVLGSDMEYVETSKIVNCFNDSNCPFLEHKPRLFFIQACRGIKVDQGVTVPSGSSRSHYEEVEDDSAGPMHIQSVPLYRDCMIMYATCSGYKAWGNDVVGSPLLHHLSLLLLDERLKDLFFLRGLTTVSREVAQHDTYIGDRCVKAMPVIDSMLLKDIMMTVKIGAFQCQKDSRKRKNS